MFETPRRLAEPWRRSGRCRRLNGSAAYPQWACRCNRRRQRLHRQGRLGVSNIAVVATISIRNILSGAQIRRQAVQGCRPGRAARLRRERAQPARSRRPLPRRGGPLPCARCSAGRRRGPPLLPGWRPRGDDGHQRERFKAGAPATGLALNRRGNGQTRGAVTAEMKFPKKLAGSPPAWRVRNGPPARR